MNRRGAIAVTGSSRGIGAAIAVALARAGCTVGCLSRSGGLPARDDMTADLATRMFPEQCDVDDEPGVKRALAAIARKAGGLWGLVNNAGIHVVGPSDRFGTEAFVRVMNTNATAVFTASREAYPYLVANEGGIIINIGSFFDKLGVKRNLAYCASKAAVGAITRCLAVEWASKGIRVVDVAPGYIQTDLNREAMAETSLRDFLSKRIPGGNAGTAEEVGAIVTTLATQDFGFLTGETIYLDGGQSINH
ncbi:MAG: SDR family NAD(P)-dependent oxidoreductase [Burkholderiales bacterium]